MNFKISKILTLVMAAFTLCVLFVALPNFEASRHVSGKATTCPLIPGHSSMCKMWPMEHMQAWQNMFIAIPLKDLLSLLSVIVVLAALLGLHFFKSTSLYNHSRLEAYISPFYLRRILIDNPLTEVFSRGILHPKIF